MKVSLTAIALPIAFLSSVTMLGKTVSAFQLSLPQEPPYHTTISQATEPLNLSLLAQTVTNLLKSDRTQTDSQTEIAFGLEAPPQASFYIKSKIITQSERKFRAEITYPVPGKDLVIGDGKQVWIYRSDLKQYAVTSYQDFIDSGNLIFIGISSFALLNVPEQDRKVAVNGNLSDKNILSYLGLASNSKLKGEKRTLDGQSVYVYEYKDLKDGSTLSAFVNPETATLKQVQSAGKTGELNIIITQKILSTTPNPTIKANTFLFSPPKGTKRVKTLSIRPF